MPVIRKRSQMEVVKHLLWVRLPIYRVRISSWIFELDFRARILSWDFDFNFQVGFSS